MPSHLCHTEELTKYTRFKNDDYTNGVSTLDLVMIQRHILGIDDLGSPYKVLAADINNDEMLSAADLLELRKLILGTITEFSDNGSWRFIDSEFEFEDADNAFATPIPDDYDIATLNNDMNIDFIALKVGDVNDNAVSNLLGGESTTRSNSNISLVVENQEYTSNDVVTVPVMMGGKVTATGMQFTIEMSSSLEFEGITSGALDIKDYNIGFSKLSDGMIAISWNTTEGITLSDDEVLFEMNFTTAGSGNIADELSINSRAVEAELYDDNMDTYNIELEIDGREISEVEFTLYQNTPNPFGQSTMITFDLPEAMTGSLTIFDLTGKIVEKVTRQFEKGYNQVSIDRDQLGASGVMYYQLEAGEYFASKKMIMID